MSIFNYKMLSQNLLRKVAKYFYAICFLLLATSCVAGYDDGGAALSPSPIQNSNQYYKGQTQYQQQSPYQQVQPQAYQQVQPQAYQHVPVAVPYYYPPQQPVYYPPVAAYPQQGGSRYYSNPYAIPPSTQYPNYDADQYYVPPTYYNNVESQQSQSQNKILSGFGTF